nr:MAG TPA: hypothetical protein [Crassvirales sp.]
MLILNNTRIGERRYLIRHLIRLLIRLLRFYLILHPLRLKIIVQISHIISPI